MASQVAVTASVFAAVRRWAKRSCRSLSDCRLAMLCGSLAGSGQRADLGEQFVAVDRLRHVVAGALAHAPDAIGLQVLAGAHDDGNGRILRIAGDGPRQL